LSVLEKICVSLSPAVELPTDSLGSDEWVSCAPHTIGVNSR